MNDRQMLLNRLHASENIIRETPAIHLDFAIDSNVDLFAKLEYSNGVGSIKDRPALWVLKRAIERGKIGPETTILESSSGNFACALAVFCKMLGLNFVPVIDPNVSPLYEQTLRFMCKNVVKVTERDDTGGFLKTRLKKIQELLNIYGDAFWTNQYENIDAVEAHYNMTGEEIAKLQVDYVFLGVSTGGTIAGVSQRIKEANPDVRVIAVDAEGSVIFGGRPKPRHLPGLGSSITPALVGQAQIDDVIIVPEVDAIDACWELLQKHRLFVGASTGSAYSAIGRYFAGRPQRSSSKVLFLCADRGAAYMDSVFDPAWVAWRKQSEHQEVEAIHE